MAIVTILMATVWMPSASASPAQPRSRVAAPVAGPRAVDRVFDLRSLSAGHRDLVRDVLGSFDFDWTGLSPANPAKPRQRVVVEVADVSAWNAVGLAWPAPVSKIQIDDQITDPTWFRDILLHELGHIVDFLYLGPRDLRAELTSLLGAASWDELKHPFIPGFIRAFSSFDTGSNDALAEAEVAEIRELLGGVGDPPTKAVDGAASDLVVRERVRHEGGDSAWPGRSVS